MVKAAVVFNLTGRLRAPRAPLPSDGVMPALGTLWKTRN
jgi:hypothetical protein